MRRGELFSPAGSQRPPHFVIAGSTRSFILFSCFTAFRRGYCPRRSSATAAVPRNPCHFSLHSECPTRTHLHIPTARGRSPTRNALHMQPFRRHAGQYPVMLCNVLPLSSVTPSALLHRGHPRACPKLQLPADGKAVLSFFLTHKKKDPSQVERAKK